MYYFNLKIITNLFLFLNNLFLIFSKLSLEQIECVADSLLITKNIQTEIFAEKIKGEKEWKIVRGISKKVLKNIKINKEEMTKFFDENYSKNCFELNKKFVKNFELLLSLLAFCFCFLRKYFSKKV